MDIFSNTYFLIFAIMALGYVVGRLEIKGLSLGTSGILLVALVCGHFGITVPGVVKTLGLACFVGSVGIIAGPAFFRNFKKGALQFIFLGFLTILLGGVATVLCIKVLDLPSALGAGMMNGALTSTPGLAAALEATNQNPMASVGYGIAYPFGVVGVVLFVQLLPRLLKTDIPSEVKELQDMVAEADSIPDAPVHLDPGGFCVMALAIAAGIALGTITVPLGGGATFSLGTSGGPLIAGLILGHFGRIGKISLRPPKHTLNAMREFGLALFLLGAGCEAGQGFLDVLMEYGVGLFFAGAFITLLPMVAVFIIATKLMKMTTMNTLGSLCGGMTSTPALGILIGVAKTDAVAVSYAATYPIALVAIVIFSQLIPQFF